MAPIKSLALVLALTTLAVTMVSGRSLQQAADLTCQATFFDDDFSGGSQTFDVVLPNGGTNGCSACTELNRIRTNSWESFLTSCGSLITLYDDHGCGGTDSGPIPARSGVIQGSLSNSVDSFVLCA